MLPWHQTELSAECYYIQLWNVEYRLESLPCVICGEYSKQSACGVLNGVSFRVTINLFHLSGLKLVVGLPLTSAFVASSKELVF